MPMPQRNSRRVVQLLSNNSLLSGTGASGISTASNCIHSGGNNNNANTTTTTNASSAANGRVYGNPMAASAAAAASASALNASAHHPQPPPLITDTLTACLDVNGTYICTSYSPRCYIIQKVTPNTVTVTPHLIGGEGPTASGVAGGSNSQGVGPPLAPLLPSSSGEGPSLATGRKPQFGKSGGGGGGGGGGSGIRHSSSSSQHLQLGNPSSFGPRPPRNPSYQHYHGSPNFNHHRYIYNSQAHKGNASSKNSPYADVVTSLSSATSSTTYTSGRAYMNGEVESTTTAFIGEESKPAMVLQSTNSSAGTQISETRVLNGLKDGSGMPREQMKSVESHEIDTADNSRRNDPGNGANPADIPIEDLKRLLLHQLEYYFSPENLANDKFLVSQMDSDHYVSISTLADFNMVKKLTGDIDLVTEVLRDSKNVQVHSDGKRVRPVSHRTVVILRGIPESTPVDEIKALFNSENCPKCNSCEFAHNDSWYVSFESDEDAQQAHRHIREDVKEFKGQPIMARIKSRPTTLLAQGAGVHLKNGFHPPAMGTFIPPSYVSGSQTGPTAVTPTPMYAHGQTGPTVFPLTPGYSYNPWQTYSFGMSPDQISQMYPMNGLPPQHQQNSPYTKSLQMNARPRNPTQIRPRRPPPSSSDNQGINGVVGAGGASSAVASHQSYGNPSRKTNSAPPPLLNIVPNPPALPLVNPTSHNHSQGHLPHSSVQVGGNAISQNGNRHFVNSSLPSSHSLDYHPSGPIRSSYRGGGVSDSRPRSSLSNRKGPPRREEETSYDGPSASPSVSTKVPSTRGAPPNVPVPQPPVETLGPHQSQGNNLNLDLEGSQFPPLPGSGQTSGKNGDAVFEGRLSDVVKGVKKMPSSEKEDSRTPAANLPTEIVVSAEEDNFGDVREVSAASPIKDLDAEKKTEHSSSHTAAPKLQKEFREVGVGSADDTHDIRSSQYNVVSRCKETADKSTRTDEALLNGDQCQGMKSGTTSSSALSQASFSQNGGNRKTASQSLTSKSPVPGKRAVPALQGQTASSTSVSVGPEVPYSSRNVTSPVTNPAKFTTSQSSHGGGGNTVSNTSGNPVPGRGANAYVAKQSTDNNNTRANGMVFNNSGSNLDRDAFPSPGFVKSVPTLKPFPNSTDQISKEVSRTDSDKDRKESGQGDGKKSDDCSNEEREGPVRLSYAQVAQQRKDTVAGGSSNNSQASTTTVNNCVSSASNSASTVLSSASTQAEEKKKLGAKDTKDPPHPRPIPPKNQRGGGGDRDRGFRRGFRNRMMSDSDGGSGSGTSGEPNRRLSKPTRSPK